MTDNALQQVPFLPQQAPSQAINDYSGQLTAQQTASLEQQAQTMARVKVKVIVLPKDFHTTDLDGIGVALATQWHTGGKRLLMLIDLKDHQIRVYPGHTLQTHGLTPYVFSSDLIPHYFIPAMKQGHLSDAISQLLTASSERMSSHFQAIPSYGTYGTQTQQAVPTNIARPDTGFHATGWLVGIGIWIAIMVAIFVAGNKSRAEQNKKLADEFKQRVGPLYENADQIGAASEYLQTKDNPDLAQRVAQFFNHLTALEKAVSEVEALEKQNKGGKVRDGYLKLVRMVSVLTPEAERLKKDVNAATGGVQTVPDASETMSLEERAAATKNAHDKVSIPERFREEMQYRRPEWTYQPAYYQPVDNGMSSLMMLGMMLNQWEMNNRLNQMNWNMQHEQGGGLFGGWNDQPQGGGGDWGNTAGGGSDAGWGDTGGGGGFGDAGGDWGGGGGDFGGGGGGGGDWG